MLKLNGQSGLILHSAPTTTPLSSFSSSSTCSTFLTEAAPTEEKNSTQFCDGVGCDYYSYDKVRERQNVP